MTQLNRLHALSYRLRVNHLTGERLPLADLGVAAAAGLQDSAPRSALLSLAARVVDVGPDDWRAPGLTQVFGPRGAIYVVPESDVGVFTRGLLPRDPQRLARLESISARAHEVLAGGSMRQRDLDAALPDVQGNRELRWTACLGTLLPVWDAIDTMVRPAPVPAIDDEAARLELARRFFRYLGPATVDDFRWWIAADPDDARATIASLGDELTPVVVAGIENLALTATLSHLTGNEIRIDSDLVHLLPPDDTYINRRLKNTLLPEPGLSRLLWPKAPPPGALVIGGEVAGTWRRRGGSVLIEAWSEMPAYFVERAEAIALQWPLGEQPVTVTWKSNG